MKRTLLLGILVVLVSCSPASNPGGAAVATNETYQIGAVLPLTGNSAQLGESMGNGMELAVQTVNENGGINGRRLRIDVQDGKLDGGASVKAAQYHLRNDVDALSVLFAPAAKAVAPIAEQNEVPMVYEAFSHSTANKSYSFKGNFDPLRGCKELIEYAKEHDGYEQLGVMMAKVEWSTLCIDAIKQVEPDVKKYMYKFGEKDYRTLLTKAKQDGVDTLVTIPVFAPINVFQQVAEIAPNMTVYCATANECIYPQVVRNVPNSTLQGTLGVDFVPANLSETGFAEAYRERFDEPTNVELAYAAFGYEQVMYLSEAMKNCPPGDGACLRNALEKVDGYKSVLNTDGFEDGVLQTENTVLRYNTSWELVDR